MPKVFIMGGMGHIGGVILDLLTRSHPEVEVRVLARDQDKADKVTSKYPRAQCVIGDFASLDLIEMTCRGADIVINAGPDITHDDTLKAVLQGLQHREGGSGAKKPYLIHTSGAEQLVSMLDTAVHRVTAKLVLSAAPQVKVAILAPAGVKGISPSVCHPLPITMPAILQCVRAFKSPFMICEGENAVGMIHVLDLARMYTVLVDDNAYYFGSATDTPYRRDWMAGLAPLLEKHGVVESGCTVKSVTAAEVARRVLFGDDYDPDAPPPPLDSWATHITHGLGANLRVRGSKMRKLGWEPEHLSYFETMDEVIPAYLEREKETAAK
ncbi:hypothetical protein PG994_003327 [Apiospora phragmitis]|uniref:Saccharopine dehydrogenase NADP binding domain-containing protein n=1 Tax=Apiospora phragmitis TaxID=2905665 RepID=A0ABR1W0W3_9PEZI